jgi:ParB-like nuclease family protein
MSSLKIQQVRIDKLVHVWDVRVNLNEDHVLTLAGLIDSGVEMPPIDITDKMEILDGRHRVQAAALAGHETIQAKIHRGLANREALVFSYRSNETGPLPMTLHDYAVVVKQLIEMGDSDPQICMSLKMPAKFLRPIISKERSRIIGHKLIKAKELMVSGKTVAQAAEEVNIPERAIQQSLRQTGRVEHSLYTKLASSVTQERNAMMGWMRRMHERIQEDYREGLITKEEIVTVWQRTRDMLQAGVVKVSDYEMRTR